MAPVVAARNRSKLLASPSKIVKENADLVAARKTLEPLPGAILGKTSSDLIMEGRPPGSKK